MLSCDIGLLELVNHLVVGRVWGHTWSGLEVTGYTDNQSAMHLLRHGCFRSELRLDIAREFPMLRLDNMVPQSSGCFNPVVQLIWGRVGNLDQGVD